MNQTQLDSQYHHHTQLVHEADLHRATQLIQRQKRLSFESVQQLRHMLHRKPMR